jgi:hypothetical protein
MDRMLDNTHFRPVITLGADPDAMPMNAFLHERRYSAVSQGLKARSQPQKGRLAMK